MKTTIEIEDHLLRQAKKVAIDRGWTLRQMVESALRREVLATPKPNRGPIRWVSGSGHFPEGVDFSSREKMWEWLESPGMEEPEGGK